MEGVTGMMARLRHVPGCSRGGLYGPANIDFRFVYELRLQQANTWFKLCDRPLVCRGSQYTVRRMVPRVAPDHQPIGSVDWGVVGGRLRRLNNMFPRILVVLL